MPVQPTPSPRKPRTDAERNRLRLLDVAKASFSANGTATSLEEIARNAGVGIGTLYRHFPTRDALIMEVYRQTMEQLAAAAHSLAETETPEAALRSWLLLFIDYLATKKLMSAAFSTLVGGTTELYANSSSTLKTTSEMLLANAKNTLPQQVEPLDLLRAIAGVANASPEPQWEQRAQRMVDILIAGMKTSPDNQA